MGSLILNQVTEYIPAFHRFLIKLYQTTEENISIYILRKPVLLALAYLMFMAGCDTGKKGEADMPVQKDTAEVLSVKESLKDTLSKVKSVLLSPPEVGRVHKWQTYSEDSIVNANPKMGLNDIHAEIDEKSLIIMGKPTSIYVETIPKPVEKIEYQVFNGRYYYN